MVRHRLLFQNDPLLNVYLSFPDDLFRVLVVAKRNEFSVSQMVAASPLQKCYLSDGLGFQPNALLHLLSSKTGSPSAIREFRKICEGALPALPRVQVSDKPTLQEVCLTALPMSLSALAIYLSWFIRFIQ